MNLQEARLYLRNSATGQWLPVDDAIAISVASLPLPTGASTEAKQDDAITQLVNILTQLQSTLLVTHTGVNVPSVNANVTNYDEDSASTLYHGTKTVPTGTAEAIASSQACSSVTVKALSTNTVAVYVGNSTVTTSGFELLPGESVTMNINNIATIYCISGSASQVVRYLAI